MTSVASPNAQSDPPTLLKAMSMSANPQSEEVPEASQRLSLDDPRMIVAMQVLGIDMEDLVAPKPPPAPPMSHDRSPRKVVSVVPAARRQELWERKKHQLRREVEAEAKGSRVAKILKEAERENESQEELSAGAEKLQQLKDRSQAEIQRAIDTEKDKLQKIQDCAERHVKMQKQVAARKAESHEQLVKAMGIRQTWREAQVIKMDTNVKLQKKENRALINKLKKAFKKVEEHKAEELEKWQIVKEEHEEKIRQVQERRDWALQVFQEELVQDYLDKEQRTQERLAEMREKAREKALKGEEEYLEKLEKSLRQIEAKQKEKEEDFLESLERQAAARVTVGQQHEEIKQEAKKHWTEKVVPKLEKKREEEERLRRKVPRRPKANSSDAMSPKKLKFLQEEAQRRLEQRQSMDELVYRNLQRLQRSHDFKTDQLLSRIEETNARSQEIKDRRQNRHLEREAVMKESLIEKARVHEELRTMKVLPTPPENEEKEKESK